MWLISNIANFFKGLFNKMQKLWNLAKPFLQEVLNQTARAALASLQSLAIEAVQYVAEKGLPDDKAKQDAFKEYMLRKAKNQVDILKDSELNLIREIALVIFKQATKK